MRYHLQKHLHDPDSGSYGDCQRVCFACLLGLDNVEEVPHFAALEHEPGEGRDMLEIMQQWLEEQGLALVRYAPPLELDEIMEQMVVWNPTIPYMVVGTSPRGNTHVVIAQDDQIIHDPHPEGGGIIAPEEESRLYWVEFLVNVQPELRPPQREMKA